MKDEIEKAIIVGIAIIIGFILHAMITKNVGRYELTSDKAGVLWRIDTTTGQVYDRNGQSWGDELELK